MSLASLIDERNIGGVYAPIDYAPTGIIGVTKAQFRSFIDNDRSNSVRSLQYEQIDKSYNRIKELTGQSEEELIGENVYNSDQRWAKRDELILAKRQEDEAWNTVLTTEEMRNAAKAEANKNLEEYERISKGADDVDVFIGSILGGIGGSIFDPINVAVTVGSLGAGALVNSSRVGLQSIGRTIATEAAIGAVTEVAMQPFVAGWYNERGKEYGLGDAMANVAFAGLVSGGIAGIASMPLRKSIEAAKDKGSIFFETIANNERTPSNLKPIMEKMADFARIRESNPFTDVKGSAIHAENVRLAEEAFNKREAFQPKIGRVESGADIEKVLMQDDNGWLAVHKETGLPAAQIFNPLDLDKINTDAYEIVVAADYLKQINQAAKIIEQPQIKPEKLTDVKKQLKDKGVSVAATEKGKKINLSKIEVPEAQRKAGLGTEAVDRVIEYADKTGKTITTDLKAANPDISKKQIKFYKDKGFVENKGKNKDASIKAAMYRKPKVAQKPESDIKQGISLQKPEEEFTASDLRALEATTDKQANVIDDIEQNQFDQMILDDPDYLITMDDGTQMRLAQIADEMRTNEVIQNAMKVCSV